MRLGGCHTRFRCSPTRGVATDAATYALVPHLRFFFFFFFEFKLTRLRFGPICAEPGKFGQNRVISAGSQNWSNQPKQAKIDHESCRNSRNQLWMRPKHPKSILPQFFSEYLLLLLCFLFCFVFLAFKNIFEMKMITYRKYIEKDVVCMLSQNKNIFLPLKHIENINKNIFNNF